MQISFSCLPQAGRRAIILVAVFLSTGCAGAGEGAVKGAGAGALAGAASGLVSALVWGGDPGEYMARGATAGATIGAIGGAVEGSNKAQAKKDNKTAQKQRELEQFRRDIGNDAFDAIVALAECKQEVASANARVAATSTNSNHALAGLWVQALTYEDVSDESGLLAITPEIIRWDREINSQSQFDRELKNTYQDLIDIRAEYALPLSCG